VPRWVEIFNFGGNGFYYWP